MRRRYNTFYKGAVRSKNRTQHLITLFRPPDQSASHTLRRLLYIQPDEASGPFWETMPPLEKLWHQH